MPSFESRMLSWFQRRSVTKSQKFAFQDGPQHFTTPPCMVHTPPSNPLMPVPYIQDAPQTNRITDAGPMIHILYDQGNYQDNQDNSMMPYTIHDHHPHNAITINRPIYLNDDEQNLERVPGQPSLNKFITSTTSKSMDNCHRTVSATVGNGSCSVVDSAALTSPYVNRDQLIEQLNLERSSSCEQEHIYSNQPHHRASTVSLRHPADQGSFNAINQHHHHNLDDSGRWQQYNIPPYRHPPDYEMFVQEKYGLTNAEIDEIVVELRCNLGHSSNSPVRPQTGVM